MSLIDQVVAAVTPEESDDARREARQQARRAAEPGDWLELVLDHHLAIEDAFEAVFEARDEDERRDELQELAIVLTGHSNAEESVLYPALVAADEQGRATMAYTEQATAKTQMALLEDLEPMSEEFLHKLEQLRSAIAHHMYEEEGTWFLELKAKARDQDKLTQRFLEEFERYVGADDPVDEYDIDPPVLGVGMGDSTGAPRRL